MGLFDFVGDLFGGGSKTSVSQAASNKTNIDLTANIANVIDVTALSEAVEAVGASVTGAIDATSARSQEMIAALQRSQVATALADLKVRSQKNEVARQGVEVIEGAVKSIGKFGKFIAVGGGILILWRMMK